MLGTQVTAIEKRTWRGPVLMVAALLGLVTIFVLAWVIVYEPSYRPWIMVDRYPPPFTDLLDHLIQVNNTRAGANIYLPVNNPNEFSYPPAAIMLFLPLTYLPTLDVFMLWTSLSILCLAATYLVVLRTTRSGTWLEHVTISVWACIVTAVLFPPVSELLNIGQVGTLLVLLVTLDVLVIRDRSQGVLVGVAAAFNLFPAVVVVFWLVRRQWRPAITASVTFALFTAVAWVAWPTNSSWFFSQMLLGGQEVKSFEYPNLAIRSASPTGLFLRIGSLPQSDAILLGLVVSAVIGVAGVLIAARIDLLGYRVCALVTILCTSVLVCPVAWDDYFTFIPLLVFVIMEVGLRSFPGKLAAVALALFTFPWIAYRFPAIHPSINQEILIGTSRNVLLGAALLVLLAGALVARRSTESMPADQGHIPSSISPAPF